MNLKKRVCHKPHPICPERAEAPSPGRCPGLGAFGLSARPRLPLFRLATQGLKQCLRVALLEKAFQLLYYSTSSQTTISVPLYTTMILCSCVVLMAEVTTSLSAYLITCLMASCLSCSTCASVSFDLAYLSSTM